jgi:hypothetical protein
MKSRIVLASLSLIVAGSVGCATTHEANWKETSTKTVTADEATQAQTLTGEGDALWEQRGDQQKLVEAIAKWEAAAALAPSVDVASKLARAHYLLGDGYYAVADKLEERDAEYQKGLDWATTALKMAAPEFAAAMAAGAKHADAIQKAPKEAVPAMYWYASNLGKWAAAKGFATRLKYKDDIKATMDHVKALDEQYFFAGPWRYFGAFEALTAGIAGGDLGKSKTNFEKAVMLAPNYLGTKVLWAETLCTKLQKDEDGDGVADGKVKFKQLLDEVIAADPNAEPALAAENALEQQKAKKLLAKIDDLFS